MTITRLICVFSSTVLRIHLILMRIRILDPHWKKMIRIQVISVRTTEFFNNAEFSYLLSYFFTYFYAKTWWTIQKSWTFYDLSFYNSSDLGFENKHFFLQFLVVILPLRSESMDLHIFVDLDPDPGRSQNIADPTDPDPKHCIHILLMV